MGNKWTDEQQSAISLHNRNLLVSAAAGAGKTAALVERIIRMVTDQNNPLDLDRLLVVTFTNAAAAEMKERILTAIEDQLEAHPQDTHLSMQATLVNTAQICTIHSFCESVIRDHFSEIELDPGFRVGEDNEIRLLQHEVMEELLEEEFEAGDPQFLDFVDAYGDKCGTKSIENIVLRVYDVSRQNPDPEAWLDECVRNYQADSPEELAESRCGSGIRSLVLEELGVCQEWLEQGLAVIHSEGGPMGYEAAFESELAALQSLINAESIEAFFALMKEPHFANVGKKSKKDDPGKVEKAYNAWDKGKNRFKKLKDKYFSLDLPDLLADLHTSLPAVKELAALVRLFGQKYQEKKKEQSLIDFSDMEQYALQVLAVRKRPGVFTSSDAAKEYQDQFVEVMIDEYQDINLIQEVILTSVSRMDRGENNLFMVGDVKQSIYGFRASRPELFLEKYHSYSKEESDCQRVDMHQNFRSRSQIVDSVNALFRQLMRQDLGGIDYNDDAALYVGAEYETPAEAGAAYDTEVLLLDGKRNAEAEARLIAGRIRGLMGKLQVQDGRTKTLRPVRYGDIAVLVHSTKELGPQIEKVFAREGIPVVVETKEGYFNTREIQVVLSYLKVLDNRQQDIPLTAVLTSPIGGLTEEDLAEIRTAGGKNQPFYAAVEQYRTQGEDPSVREKLETCLGQMDTFRQLAPYTSVQELLWKILDETGYGDFVAAMPGGEQRQANLEFLVDRARAYESTGRQGLFHFIRYIEKMQDEKMDFGEADLVDEQADAVRVMTIHKSKGLEFPVVFVAEMGRQMKISADKENGVIADSGFGIGLEYRDLSRRVKSSGLVADWIQDEKTLEERKEELRLLYVAFTRAREKLILVGHLKEAEESLDNYTYSLTYNRRISAVTYWDLILPAMFGSPEGTPISWEILTGDDLVKNEVQTDVEHRLDRAALERWDTDRVYDPAVKAQLEAQFTYTYPYADEKNQKLKFTVSELKKRTHMQETMKDTPPEEELGEELFEEPDVVPLIPKFMQKEQEPLAGADRGTAYHRVLELLDLTRSYDQDSLLAAVCALAADGKITRDMADCIRMDDLLYFLSTDSGQRMKAAAGRGQLHREQPFVLGVDTREIYPDAKEDEDEITLIQGIIDVYFEEPDGLVVLDYKTDKVTAGQELADKYHAQVDYYAKALEQMLQKPVKEKIIYSFTLREEIRL